MFSPRMAWSLALGCVAWHGIARIGQMLDVATTYGLGPAPLLVAGAAVIIGLVTAQMFLATERGPRQLLLVVMVAGTLAPVPLLGGAWPSIGGLVGAAILLTVRIRWSPSLVAVVLGADALLYWLFSQAGGAILGNRVLMNVNVTLTLFAVIRLARLIQQIHDARIVGAQALVEVEKEHSAQWLRSALGTRLAELIAATRRICAAPTVALDDVTHLARTAHRAAETARRAVEVRSRPHLPHLATGRTTTTNDYALSWAVSVLLTVVFGAVALLNLFWLDEPTASTGGIATVVALSAGALHLYHGTPRPNGGEPRWWPWTLAAQALLVVPAVWAGGAALFLPYIVLLAGSATTRLRGPWLWFLPLVVFAGAPATAAWLSPSWTTWTSANLVGGLATIMIALYALCHLPWVATLLRQTRTEFARTAVAAERSNFARDVHDLLGFHLSAMVLNAELAARDRATDIGAARERVDTVRLCAQRAMADLRSIHDDAGAVSAEREITEAASLLRAAGIQVVVVVEVPRGAIPHGDSGRADHIAGIIVREASANIVRHAWARRCSFRLGLGAGGEIELDIINDGAQITGGAFGSPAATGDGRGLGNLTARVEEAGGSLTTTHRQGTFQLTARIPGHPPGLLQVPVGAGVKWKCESASGCGFAAA